MKKVLIALLLFLPLQTLAAGIFSGSVALASDYIWRGQTQNNGNYALSGGLEAALGNVTIGTWASHVDFQDEANFEYDLYVNAYYDINDTFGVSAGYQHVRWDKGYDPFNEAYIGVSIGDLGVTYHQDLENSSATFINVIYSVPFINIVGVSLEYGKMADFEAYQAINISRELGNYAIGGQIGTDETFIGISYSF